MATNSRKVPNLISITLKVVVAIGLVAYLIQSGHLDPKDLWRLMTPTNVALGLGLIGLSTYLAAWRWILLLRARGIPLAQGYGVSLYLIGIFFNHALPGAVGGDVVRGYYLVADYPTHRMVAILSVLIDRILGLYSFFILTLIAVAFDFRFVMGQESLRWLAYFAAAMFLGMSGFFAAVFSKRLGAALGLNFLEKHVPALHRIVVGFQTYGERRAAIANSILISMLAQTAAMAFFYQVAWVSGENVTWPAILFAVPMGFLVTAIPISPAGVGVGQVAFLYLFKTYLQRDTQFGAMSITAFQLAMASWGVVGAGLYLKRRRPEMLTEIAT